MSVIKQIAAVLLVLSGFTHQGTAQNQTVPLAGIASEHIQAAPSDLLKDVPLLMVSLADLRFPPEALRAGIEGAVVVTYVVRPDGTASNVQVIRGLGHGCDEEARRLIENMWIEPMRDAEGQPMAQRFYTVIPFSLSAATAL